MRTAETLLLEIKVLDDGALLARRKDRKPCTAADHDEARKLADSLPGITADDAIRVFRGGRVISKERY